MASGASRIYIERQLLTRSPLFPTVPAAGVPFVSFPVDPGEGKTPVNGDGMPLDSIQAVSIWVIANAGQTLSGGGRLEINFFDYDVAQWGGGPDFDLNMSWASAGGGAARTSVRTRFFPILRVPQRAGRVSVSANGITVSAGVDVLIIMKGSTSFHPS